MPTTILASDQTNYIDVSYLGSSVYPFVLSNEAVTKNAIKMYLFSSKGDYGRNLTKGGVLIPLLNKPMTETSPDEIKSVIIKALSIYTNIQIQNLEVTRTTDNKGWHVSISFADTINKFMTTTSLSLLESSI